VVKIIIVLSLLALFGACRLTTSSYPNVVVIAVDQLGVDQVNCAQESHLQKSGIELLCQESVRFTHAFTTSPLSAPAIASVLTGQYPFQHKLRTNGKDFIPSQIITPAEWAQKAGVATAFFSGGPPILRKTNLHQGFEIFDDHLNPSMSRLFRPFAKTQSLFENWLKDLGRQSFLAVFYVPDLNFTDTQTQTEMGEVRNLTFDSQLEEFDASLFRFLQNLKQQKLWDSTEIILVGLNGVASKDRDELDNLNLYSDRTHIEPPMKPVRNSNRDHGMK
jgi:arylsulfatase A-like enzyme